MNAAAALILVTLDRREAEIAAEPDAPAWHVWDAERQQEARAAGPEWSDVTAQTGGDAERMRLTRALPKLEAAGLVSCSRHEFSGRLKRVKLTAKGREAAKEAAGAEPAAGNLFS